MTESHATIDGECRPTRLQAKVDGAPHAHEAQFVSLTVVKGNASTEIRRRRLTSSVNGKIEIGTTHGDTIRQTVYIDGVSCDISGDTAIGQDETTIHTTYPNGDTPRGERSTRANGGELYDIGVVRQRKLFEIECAAQRNCRATEIEFKDHSSLNSEELPSIVGIIADRAYAGQNERWNQRIGGVDLKSETVGGEGRQPRQAGNGDVH